ncbi:hypothetical protein EDC44_1234 [Cricetibacter osteomyelitidis]|uniref:Lipoprotein n=1 Tax=Cricetibacter osteomyelitidis TaxID=1521931 RepID=A0A4R2SVA5_9PAST|nr:hypothetical protein EDC44_1234 [Cricetibacter osteomyelitidis]
MLKKLSFIVVSTILLSACSSWSDYIPFIGGSKSVINLEQNKIDQKSYAVAYQATVQTYTGRVSEDYLVDDFARGANDWLMGRVSLLLEQIRQNLYSEKGVETKTFAYYSGVIFAGDLQSNFSRLNVNCWSNIDRASLSQGIYDAMLDLRGNKVRSENDEYLVKGSEQLLNVCQSEPTKKPTKATKKTSIKNPNQVVKNKNVSWIGFFE